MEIKIINKSSNPLPNYQTEESAGMDIRAHIPEGTIFLGSFSRDLIETGLFLEIPKGYEGQIRPRSGLALKKGITVLNSPGTIDSDYRGELKILLINLSSEQVEIKSGDRIAQLIIAKHEKASWVISESLRESARGEGGYGHTGLN
jgi:dUTP pyrophosphatase